MRRSALAIALVAATLALGHVETRVAATTDAAGLAVTRVEAVGFTVSDMTRALDFYTGVLPFERVSDVEVAGREYELLTGVFGARARIVRLKLGDELLELTEYLAPRGRPIPPDVRSNDVSSSTPH